MRQLCEDVLAHSDEYMVQGTDEIYWEMSINCNDHENKCVYATVDAVRTYPDCWDEFVQLVYDLTGQDVNGLLGEYTRS